MSYLDVVYSEKEKPYTDYPYKLTEFIFETFIKEPNINRKYKLLDLGCGRGEYLNTFNKKYWIKAEGFDKEQISTLYPFKKGNLCYTFPYKNEEFDIIFCKSVIEHFNNPDHIFSESKRILKPGGKFIILTPDWESDYRTFYEDHTHIRPFTIVSLENLFLIHKFRTVFVAKFRQLPFLWHLHPILFKICCFICNIAGFFYNVRTKNKFIKFSKKRMIIGVGIK